MTASELIRLLQEFPPDTKIVVRGYEDGYNDILKLRMVKIKYNSDVAWYYGVYSDSRESDVIDAVDLYCENYFNMICKFGFLKVLIWIK